MSRWADSTDEEDYVPASTNPTGDDGDNDELFDGPTKSFNDDEVRRYEPHTIHTKIERERKRERERERERQRGRDEKMMILSTLDPNIQSLPPKKRSAIRFLTSFYRSSIVVSLYRYANNNFSSLFFLSLHLCFYSRLDYETDPIFRTQCACTGKDNHGRE